jgi:hypothetical protein
MSFQPASLKRVMDIKDAPNLSKTAFAIRVNLPQNGSCRADLDNFSLLG